MDTKLKNTRTKTVKIIALVLAAVMFFASGTFASLFLRGFFSYSIFTNPENVTQTTSFRHTLDIYIEDLIYNGLYQSYDTYESFLNSQRAREIIERYNNVAAEALNAYDLLDKSGVEVFYDAQNRYRYSKTFRGVIYRFSYNGDLITNDAFSNFNYVVTDKPETTKVTYTVPTTDVTGVTVEEYVPVSDGNNIYYDPDMGGNYPNEIAEIGEALLKINNIDGNLACYGEVSKEQILERVEAQKKLNLESNYNDLSINGWRYNYFNSVKNINYAVVYNDSKNIYTNCGITLTDNREQIVQKLGSTTFAECRENGRYTVLVGKSAAFTPDNIFSACYNMLMGRGWLESDLAKSWFSDSYPDVDRIYIAYADKEKAIDAFTVIKSGFDNYSKSYSLGWLIILFALSFIIACGASIYYLTLTGKTENGIKINFLDKVPFEINWVLGLAVMAVLVFAVVCIFDATSEPLGAMGAGAGAGIAFIRSLSEISSMATGLCVLLFFMIWVGLNASAVRNFRNKTFTRHSIIFWILKPVKIFFKWCKKQVCRIKEALKFDYTDIKGRKFRIISVALVVLFAIATMTYYWIAGIEMSNGSEELGFILSFLGIVGDGLIVVYIILSAISLDRIMTAVSAIRNGEIGTEIDTKYMTPFMKSFAADIIGVQDGLQNAVESAVKDQRMKAELITNVSHDLKTPLTSVVNYVDLLKKCEIEDETAQKYVSILDEKAHKMKKLVEDLVEASKASSGAIEIHTVKLNLCEFATQAVGEHSDELNNYNIDLLLKNPENPVMVAADAQKVSRIAENLFSNIRKYALEGTRVYVEVSSSGAFGMLTFKNISKHPLDISPDELTQRFVRGDASRSGEGSGLGLSIAKDLCELQGGKLDLQIDGDLFKATVALPLAKF